MRLSTIASLSITAQLTLGTDDQGARVRGLGCFRCARAEQPSQTTSRVRSSSSDALLAQGCPASGRSGVSVRSARAPQPHGRIDRVSVLVEGSELAQAAWSDARSRANVLHRVAGQGRIGARIAGAVNDELRHSDRSAEAGRMMGRSPDAEGAGRSYGRCHPMLNEIA
jgi:hypothetical protein